MPYSQNSRKIAAYLNGLRDFNWHVCPFPYGHMGASIVDASLQAGMNYEKAVRPRVDALRAAYPSRVTTSDFDKLLSTVPLGDLIRWKGSKLDRIRATLRLFLDEKVDTEAELKRWIQTDGNPDKLTKIPGIKDKTLDYYRLISGLSTVAIDRHLLGFIKNAGVDVTGYDEAHRLLLEVAGVLGKSAKDLDHSIWRFMSDRAKVRTRQVQSCAHGAAPKI